MSLSTLMDSLLIVPLGVLNEQASISTCWKIINFSLNRNIRKDMDIMSFNKTVLLTPVAALFLVAGIAQAATSAQVTITGQIAAATCDLAVTQSNIDLGTVISGDVTATGPINSTSRNFTLNLTACTAAQATTGSGSVPSLFARGTAMAANTNYFNNVDGATVGVQLTAAGQPVKPNQSTGLTTLTGLTAGGSAQVAMNAQLYSTVITPASQQIAAPVTFSVAYN